MTKKLKSFECARCEEYAHATTTLVGGYVTNLCSDCQNAWDRFIRDQPAFQALTDVRCQIGMLLARSGGDGIDRLEDLRRLVDLEAMNTNLLFEIGEAWVTKANET